MHIVHIASELAPIAKVGGLGDVIHGLSKELQNAGHTVEIVLPKYDCLDYEGLKNLKVAFRELWVLEGTHRYNNTIWSASIDGMKVILIEPHHPQYYFTRGMIYGCHDDIDRFIYFSKVAMEHLFKAGKAPDAIHVHDWPTALAAVLFKEVYQPLGYCGKGTVLTLHNMEHQGKCQPFNLSKIGLSGENYLSPEKMQDPHFPALLNLLKGGIVYADRITTVSRSYEKEIQTVEGSFGLADTLIEHRKKLTGILNGIDEDSWNPEKDPYLAQRYRTHNVQNSEAIRKAKQENKQRLRTLLDLSEEDKPLIACVTRLVAQKAPHLIKQALLRTVEKGGQFVLLGSAGSAALFQEFEQLNKKLQASKQARILLNRDEALSHLIFAAADMFIIPSLFEPCGLTQLISFRYGTVPLARMTGGLKDTVFDIDTSPLPFEERNGFTFDFPDASGVNWVVDRALACYHEDPQKFQTIQLHGMAKDYSWKHAVKNYVEIYKQLSIPQQALTHSFTRVG